MKRGDQLLASCAVLGALEKSAAGGRWIRSAPAVPVFYRIKKQQTLAGSAACLFVCATPSALAACCGELDHAGRGRRLSLLFLLGDRVLQQMHCQPAIARSGSLEKVE